MSMISAYALLQWKKDFMEFMAEGMPEGPAGLWQAPSAKDRCRGPSDRNTKVARYAIFTGR